MTFRAGLLCLALLWANAHGQPYPAKPLTLIIPFPPGGSTDIVGRIAADALAKDLGQALVIDNRGGAGGAIGARAIADAAPDGYTLGVANTGNIVINPYLMRHMPYDPLHDLVPVGPIGTVPLFLVMNSAVPAATLAEFIAYAKARPDAVSYAAAGVGTTPDLAAHEFNRRAGLKLVFVPFRGTAPAVTAVLGGDVQVTFVSMGPHIEFVRQGKLRVLGAATPKRAPYLPEVPTFAEQGFPGFETSTWFSLFAPRATPREIVDALNGFVRELADDADASKRLAANFIDPLVLTAPQFADLVKADAAKWQRIVREAGVTID